MELSNFCLLNVTEFQLPQTCPVEWIGGLTKIITNSSLKLEVGLAWQKYGK